MLRMNMLIEKTAGNKHQTFFSELITIYVTLSERLGTFHRFIFPIICIKPELSVVVQLH